MKTIKINNEKYFLPENWTEVSLSKLQQLVELTEKNKNISETSAEIDSATKLEVAAEVLSIISGCPKELLMKAKVQSINDLCNEIGWTSDFSEQTLGIKDKDGKYVKAISLNYEIDGQHFVFDHTMNLTFGQMIDLEQVSNSSKVQWDNIHLIMAILIRPAKKRGKLKSRMLNAAISQKLRSELNKPDLNSVILPYQIQSIADFEVEDYDWNSVEHRAKLFQDRCSAADAVKVAFFLAFLKEKSTLDTLGYSAEKGQQNSLPPESNMAKNGVGGH